jgi:hypothetical protein
MERITGLNHRFYRANGQLPVPAGSGRSETMTATSPARFLVQPKPRGKRGRNQFFVDVGESRRGPSTSTGARGPTIGARPPQSPQQRERRPEELSTTVESLSSLSQRILAQGVEVMLFADRLCLSSALNQPMCALVPTWLGQPNRRAASAVRAVHVTVRS